MNPSFQPYGSEQTNGTPVPTPSTRKVGKFKASKMIVGASWNMLKKDKEMLLFPILSFFATMIAVAILCTIYFYTIAGGDVETLRTLSDENVDRSSSVAELAFLFVFYLVTYFIATYFEAGVVAIADARIKGRDLAFSDGMHAASSKAGKLFVWSAVNATVGVILRVIAERSKLLGRIVVSLLGAAWSILTYFILPVLMLEEKGIKESLARSGESIKKTWGETVIVNVGVGLYVFVLALAGLALLIGAFMTGSGLVILLAGILFFVYVIGLALISSTLGVIFKVVLYEYATNGTLPEAFPEEVIRYAFAPQK